jgi:hypothetical protein
MTNFSSALGLGGQPSAGPFAAFVAAFVFEKTTLIIVEKICWTILYPKRKLEFMGNDRPQNLMPGNC